MTRLSVAAMQQIADWLKKLGMSDYADRFVENRIDLPVLQDLTDQDLKDLCIVLGDRRKRSEATQIPITFSNAFSPLQLISIRVLEDMCIATRIMACIPRTSADLSLQRDDRAHFSNRQRPHIVEPVESRFRKRWAYGSTGVGSAVGYGAGVTGRQFCNDFNVSWNVF
jgi:SAM domain (Sterile alpha motif)